MRISTILADEKVRLSCEVFPPKKFVPGQVLHDSPF